MARKRIRGGSAYEAVRATLAGAGALTIDIIAPSEGCTVADWGVEMITPGAAGALTLKLRARGGSVDLSDSLSLANDAVANTIATTDTNKLQKRGFAKGDRVDINVATGGAATAVLLVWILFTL
jgi:hypothetical protein